MTDAPGLTDAELATIDEIVARYRRDFETAERLAVSMGSLVSIKRLASLIHSVKVRTKDPDHLHDKLIRKVKECKVAGEAFSVTPDNLFERINDLAGVRLLHLHTTQFGQINQILVEQIAEEGFKILEGPIARVWDDEYRGYFDSIGIATVKSERMYTSVHYVVEPNKRTKLTAEIQVRTLAEEIWGEVDHSINYPHKTSIVSCQEQIKVLARVTSSCTRLVDSIFRSMEEPKQQADAEKPFGEFNS